MKCWVCGEDNWESLKDINPERELLCCKECAALAYKVEPEKEPEIKEYYRKHYRPAPDIGNLITTSHKKAYIQRFLADFLKDRKRSVIGRPLICGDVGCATGYIPHWLREMGHKATGCELTLTYRRFAEHFYSVPVTEELETKHKYDLITIYHVLEHLLIPDDKLALYASLLAPGGHLLISTPEWMDTLEEASGSTITDFKTLFHKDHINVFTKNSMMNLLNHAGLVVMKEDHVTYGQTYLLRRAAEGDELKRLTRADDWRQVIEKVKQQKQAIELYQERKYEDALRIWPKFPDAWIRMVHEDNSKDRDKQADIFERAFAVLPDNLRLKLSYATWLYMGEDLDKALVVFGNIIQFRPNEDIFIFMGWCLSKMGRNQEAIRFFAEAAEMNPLKWAEAMNAIAKCAVSLPCWEERAATQAKEALFAKAQPKFAMVDPVMEGADAQTAGK